MTSFTKKGQQGHMIKWQPLLISLVRECHTNHEVCQKKTFLFVLKCYLRRRVRERWATPTSEANSCKRRKNSTKTPTKDRHSESIIYSSRRFPTCPAGNWCRSWKKGGQRGRRDEVNFPWIAVWCLLCKVLLPGSEIWWPNLQVNSSKVISSAWFAHF